MLRNEKGSAMVFSIIALAVISIFSISFIFLGNSNAKHAKHEEKKTQAYYVAKTGAESMLNAAESSDDIVGKLNEFKDAGVSIGTFDEKEFEVEVTKVTDPTTSDDEYHIKSTATVEDGAGNESTDWTIAVVKVMKGLVFPHFDGTIFGGGKPTDIKDLNQLEGDNLKIYTRYYIEDDPVRIENPETVRDALPKMTNDLKVGDFIMAGNYKLQVDEKFEAGEQGAGKIKTVKIYEKEKFKVEIRYGYNIEEEFKEELAKQKIITDKYFKDGYGSGKITEKGKKITESISHNEGIIDNWEIDATTDAPQEPLVVKLKTLKIKEKGNLTIKTSKNRDIIIVANEFETEGYNDINVEGDGQLSILVSSDMQFSSYSHMRIAKKANVDIHLEPGVYFKLNDDSSIDGASMFALGATVNIHGGAKFKGQIVNKILDLNGEANVGSFSEDELKDKHTREPQISVEWKR